MDLKLSEIQESLKESARRFLASEFPTSVVRQIERGTLGYAPEIWRQMSDLSWMAAPFAGEYGGLDGSLLDVAVITEELAQAAALTPYVPTIVAGLVIQRVGSQAQKDRFLRAVCEEGVEMSVALVEPTGTYEPAAVNLAATRRGDGYVLNGTKLFVEYANAAKELICVARTRSGPDAAVGITLFIVPTDAHGITRESLKVIGGDQQSEVVFTNVEVSADRVLGVVDEGWTTVEWMLNIARSLASMEQVGFAQRALDMTVDYVGYREAFGVPIGSFQATHHRCADMAIALEGARWATYEAIWRLDEGLDATYLASAAKAIADRAGREVTMSAHLLHAGIGYMEEFDLQFYSRRAKGWELKWGTPDQMYLKVADSLGI